MRVNVYECIINFCKRSLRYVTIDIFVLKRCTGETFINNVMPIWSIVIK